MEGEPLDPPQALPWYPDRLAWQLSFSRAQLRKLVRSPLLSGPWTQDGVF